MLFMAMIHLSERLLFTSYLTKMKPIMVHLMTESGFSEQVIIVQANLTQRKKADVEEILVTKKV